jgi:hypothetical protein
MGRTIRQAGEPELAWEALGALHGWRGRGSLLRQGRGAVASIRVDFRRIYWWGVTFKGYKPRQLKGTNVTADPIKAETFGGNRPTLAAAQAAAEAILRRGPTQ